MKIVYRIAQAELRNLFYSPVAWFLIIAFFLQCSVVYIRFMESLVLMEESLRGQDVTFLRFPFSITEAIFVGNSGVFKVVIRNLYLFIPLLTMGLISREINNGSIRLLTSSPINERQIVLGKYSALLVLNLMFIVCLIILIILGFFSIEAFDFGYIIGALVGTYLLICAYSAIGLYMSSLTSYQIVSAVAVFLTIYVLEIIGTLWQQYDFIRDLTYVLSISGRSSKMLWGLVTSKDIIYFILVIFMFLSFTLIKLRSNREARRWYQNAIRYISVIVIVLVVGYLSHRPENTLYWDLTREKVNTIHPNTQAVLARLDKDEPLKITLYANLLGQGFERGKPEVRNLMYLSNLWERYQRFKPNIEYQYVYYYDIPSNDSSYYHRYPDRSIDEIAEIVARRHKTPLSQFKTPAEIRSHIDLDSEGMRLLMELEYKGKKTFLRTFDDTRFWPNEMNVAAAFRRLIEDKPPLVLYTTGNLERSIHRYGEREFSGQSTMKGKRNSLINIGFDADTVNLESEEIPRDAAFLVVADPKVEFSKTKSQKIVNYIEQGGNLFFLGEPEKQEILNPILNRMGVELGRGTLVQISENEMPQNILAKRTKESFAISNAYLDENDNNGHPEYLYTPEQKIPGSSPVLLIGDENKFEYIPIMHTEAAKNTFSRVGKLVVDSIPPEYEPEIGDYVTDSFYTSIGLSRELTTGSQRVFVSGDADYFNNLRGSGGELFLDVVNWLDNNRLPVFAPRRLPIDSLFTTSSRTIKIQYYALVWALPIFLTLFASILLIRRKRK